MVNTDQIPAPWQDSSDEDEQTTPTSATTKMRSKATAVSKIGKAGERSSRRLLEQEVGAAKAASESVSQDSGGAAVDPTADVEQGGGLSKE